MNKDDNFKYFKIEPLFQTSDLNILADKENEYIEHYDTHLNGYNSNINRNGVKPYEEKLLPDVNHIKPHRLQTIEKRQIGVWKHNNPNTFYSTFVKKGITFRLGVYSSEIEARICYDIAICNFFEQDKIKYLNYPEYMEIYKGLRIDKEKHLPTEVKKALKLFFQYSRTAVAV